MKITTNDLARVMIDTGIYPIATGPMIREWIEQGAIDVWKNPCGKKYFLKPAGLKKLFMGFLEINEEDTTVLLKRLGLDAKQLMIL